MKSIPTLLAVLAAFFSSAAAAQHSAYSGQEKREIKALSDEEIRQYRSGAGMGYARTAELNSFPGPMHVLELADQLAITPSQRAATERLMAAHKNEARAIGARLVEAERALDRLFADGKVSESALAERVRAVAGLQGEYRLSHLETHRRLRDTLTPEQVRRYDELRGYSANPQGRDKALQNGKQHH
jgi:Spy/CpxP family protein refolding chaperone